MREGWGWGVHAGGMWVKGGRSGSGRGEGCVGEREGDG